MSVSVKLDTAGLDRLQRELEPKAKAIVKKVSFEVKNRSEANAPIDTSALKNSHAVRMRGSDDSMLALAEARRLNPSAQDARPPMPTDDMVAHVGPTVHYAIYQEMGTRRGLKGKHYLENAVEAMRSSWDAAWKKLI